MPKSKFERWAPPVAVSFLTFLAFLPALRAQFLAIDDEANFLNNPHYRGLGLEHLRWMFFEFFTWGVYQPLSWMSHAVDYLLWGINPAGYHFDGMLWHSLNAALLYWVVLKLLNIALPRASGDSESPARWSAAFAALFFSVHPLRVEDVAWVSNRSYLVPGTFFLLTIAAYLEARSPSTSGGTRRKLYMAGAIAAFAASLFAKAIAVTAPALLLVLDVYPLRRLGKGKGWWNAKASNVWAEKIPFFILSGVSALIAGRGRQEFGTVIPLDSFGWGSRLAQSFFDIIFYLEKTLIPLGLTITYALPKHLDPLDSMCLPRTLAFLAISTLLILYRRRRPEGLAVWVCYLILLFPFLGISKYGALIEIAADKWTYLASMPLSVLMGSGLLRAWRRLSEAGADGRTVHAAQDGEAKLRVLKASAGAAVLAWSALTWRQTGFWHDTETLLRHQAAVEPDCDVYENNLAVILNSRQKYDEAIVYLKAALRANPLNKEAPSNLAIAYAGKGMIDDAIRETRNAIQFGPPSADAHYNLGYFLSRKGNSDEAMKEMEIAIQLNPGFANAHYNLGYFLQTNGKLDEAAQEYQETLRYNPSAANAHFNLGVVLTSQHKYKDAAYHCSEAYRLNPANDSPLCKRNSNYK